MSATNSHRRARSRKVRRRDLLPIAKSFTVSSLANGHMLVVPKYQRGAGGVLSRLALAVRMGRFLNGR